MECAVCGRSMIFTSSTDNSNGIVGHWSCLRCKTLSLAQDGDVTLTLYQASPNYRCCFDNGDSLDVSDDGDILYNDKPVESLDDVKKVLSLIVKGMVRLSRG